MASQKLELKTANGVSFQAELDLPVDGKPQRAAILTHCFDCNQQTSAIQFIASALNQKGFAVLRLDVSEDATHYKDISIEQASFVLLVEQLSLANEYLVKQSLSTALLVGHSIGGMVSVAAFKQLPDLKALALINSPSNSELVQILHKSRLPLLLLHSPQDNTVGIDNASELFKSAFHPKSFISLDGMDHYLSKQADALYVGQQIASWASRYLDSSPDISLESEHQAAVRLGSTGYTCEIKIGRHQMLADEPINVGGADLGASPYGLLQASLGACTAMTMRMYADRKKWPIEEVLVHLNHSKIHARDCAECEDKNARIDKIERIIEIKGDLDDSQKKSLIEIADKCPVHRTLHSEILIETRLAEND